MESKSDQFQDSGLILYLADPITKIPMKIPDLDFCFRMSSDLQTENVIGQNEL